MSEHRDQQITAALALRLVLLQLAVTLILSSALLVLVDGDDARVSAGSALAGGSIATLANAWFAFKVFNLGTMQDPVRVLRSFYWGEINKIIITGALFITAFVLIDPVNGAALIAVYFVVHMTPFVASMFIKNNTDT